METVEAESTEFIQPTQSTYHAFLAQLRSLCLDEFPCGMGSWREFVYFNTVDKNGRTVKTVKKDADPVTSKFGVTLKEYPVQTEKTDQLEEFVKSPLSPWQQDYGWSEEARHLREVAVTSPWLVRDKYVHGAFKSLKILNKNVNEIDRDVLRLRNLEELTLSANWIRSAPSNHLPVKLQVLELCGNLIDDMGSLCVRPIPLIHLGLGHNQLTATDDYINAELWPHLLSLDLSHNHLTDLFDIVSKLTNLPKLRNLLLQGNPLSLIPGYRGYVIDSVRLLQILDDVRITADERHNFRGLAKRKDHIFEEVKITLGVDFIRGLPVPEEVKKPDDRPEFPIINRKYFVEFYFPRGPPRADVIDVSVDDTASVITSLTADRSSQDNRSRTPGDATDRSGSRVTTAASQQPLHNEQGSQDGGSRLYAIRSAALPYDQDLELMWSQTYTRDDLLLMRDFLKDGMNLSIMEEKILSYPADQMNQTRGSKKDKKKDAKKEKGGKGDDKKDDKKKNDKKKKKKALDIDLCHMPAELTVLASFFVPLADFLDGESVFEAVLSKEESEGGVRTETKSVKAGVEIKDKKKERELSATGKKHKKEVPKSAKDKKVGKDKGSKVDKTIAEGDEELPPPPLEVAVNVKLLRWQTAVESL